MSTYNYLIKARASIAAAPPPPAGHHWVTDHPPRGKRTPVLRAVATTWARGRVAVHHVGERLWAVSDLESGCAAYRGPSRADAMRVARILARAADFWREVDAGTMTRAAWEALVAR